MFEIIVGGHLVAQTDCAIEAEKEWNQWRYYAFSSGQGLVMYKDGMVFKEILSAEEYNMGY